VVTSARARLGGSGTASRDPPTSFGNRSSRYSRLRDDENEYEDKDDQRDANLLHRDLPSQRGVPFRVLRSCRWLFKPLTSVRLGLVPGREPKGRLDLNRPWRLALCAVLLDARENECGSKTHGRYHVSTLNSTITPVFTTSCKHSSPPQENLQQPAGEKLGMLRNTSWC